MSPKTGRYAIIEQLLKDGITYMFGNPGTVEQGFLDALREYPQMKYVLTLQESVAVLMADGYARAAQRPGLVQLHSSPGIGNGVGALYQALRGHAPIVVIGGDAGIKYQNMDAQMAADLVAMMEPVTKYATVVTEAKSLLRTLRRAIKIAMTPPMGPVYVCLPMDILDLPNAEEIFPTLIPSTRVVPEAGVITQAAQMLACAAKPMIFIGDGIAYSGASAELTRVAELLGAEVYGVDIGDFNMDTTHLLYQGSTGHMFGSSSLAITQKGDVNLVVGTYMLPEVFPELGDIYAPGAQIIHFDLNAYEIAKNHRVDLGAVCDPKLSLAALAQALEKMQNLKQQESAKQRTREIGEAKEKKRAAQLEADNQKKTEGSPSMVQFCRELAQKLPAETIIFDEALTSSPELARYLPARSPGSYFQTRGGSLGVGIPGAIGIKLAHPEKTVIGFTGDGGSMYTIQALWSAAHQRIGAKFVICNNHHYRLLELNIQQYWKEMKIPEHAFPEPFVLNSPDIDFTRIAESMGVPAIRVEKSSQINAAIDNMLKTEGPFLIDLVL
ncbi:MAG: thiamine pyrophosphate-binding protein [Candidatus Omnitrophica bacterium]|nr:thiamine pyrophosphate-binding protein [Candidatus Omnitrophota bacterium]